MEKDAAAQTTSPSTPAPAGITPPPRAQASAVPQVDLKAPLKIETASSTENEPHDKYGKKTYLLGVVFCVVLITIIGCVVYFWTLTNH